MLGGIGVPELLIIFLIVLLFFGARRLPEIGGSLGKGIREFRDSLKGVEEEINREIPPGDSRGTQQQGAAEPTEHEDGQGA
jgi:sec-independent protein translocase protein TatA